MRNKSLHIKLTETEKEEWQREAQKEGISISEFTRKCVGKCLENQTLKIKEGKTATFIEEDEKNRKDNIIMIRVSNSEYLFIRRMAKEAGLSLSEFMRRQSKGQKIVVIHGLKEYSNQLRKIGVNLNQLTYLANDGRIFAVELESIKEQITEMWNVLSHFVKERNN